MRPDAGYYEARGGSGARRYPIPARIIVKIAPNGDRDVVGYVDGQKIADVISAWMYWRPISLERYNALKAQPSKEEPGKRSDLKWQKPII